MRTDSVYLFTRFGMGHGPAGLQTTLAIKFLSLMLESGEVPNKILFYTDGVRLACAGSPVLEQLRRLETLGCELILCKTCLDTFGLSAEVGVIGGMGDILTAMQTAPRVFTL